jgi:pyruvate dehydrogenase E1 component alpha subunit
MFDYPEELLLRLYRTMYSIRRFEETVSGLAGMGRIPGFMIHLYVGQEAIAAGVGAALRADDYIVSTHRGHGHLIAKGGRLDLMMAELMGKEAGYCRGRGGSMHITSAELGSLGANGIVGAGLVIAPGAALSAKLRGTDQVTACFFGDGASNQGTFHEGLNLAATWGLPVVFFCENNGYGFSTPRGRHQSVARISQRALAYDIPGITIDGNDVLEVYTAAEWAVERARKGGGPALIEATTFRWHGHFEDDDDDYRSKDEKAAFAESCPIDCFERTCVDHGWVKAAVFEGIRGEVDSQVEQAVAFAEQCEEPLPEDDASLVFAGGDD